MAQQGIQLQRETFMCSICLDLLKDPVALPCGHSYCMHCIQNWWDGKQVQSCPQCRQSFSPSPALVKNTMLAAVVEELKKTSQAGPAEHCYAGPEDVACDFCTGKKMKALKFCLVCLVSYCKRHLQPHFDSPAFEEHRLIDPCKSRQTLQQRILVREKDVKLLRQELKAISLSADKAVEDGEKIFAELISWSHTFLEKRRSDVRQQIRSQQESEAHRVRELQEMLERELCELKGKDAELKQAPHVEDRGQFLLNYPPSSPLGPPVHTPGVHARPRTYFESLTTVLWETRDQLLDFLTEKWMKISWTVTQVDVLLSQPEPETRAEFLKYSREITLDPNSANRRLLLSERNRKATLMGEEQSYSRHPDRFTGCWQVLSRESLTGRCYWEVEWRGGGPKVAVAYRNISRAGGDSVFGLNDKSWTLDCFKQSFIFQYNSILADAAGPQSFRVGVYLDHRAGILSFYSVSETMTLLHRVQTAFTQPLCAGLHFYWSSPGDTAEFVQLR